MVVSEMRRQLRDDRRCASCGLRQESGVIGDHQVDRVMRGEILESRAADGAAQVAVGCKATHGIGERGNFVQKIDPERDGGRHVGDVREI